VSKLEMHQIDAESLVSDLWGWIDPVTGTEWALVGHSSGTSFVSLGDPQNPVHMGVLPMTQGATSSVWRDIKVYNDHAFIVADGAGPHGMQVFDLTQLRQSANPPVTFTATAHYDNVASVHNIVINEETGFAYAVGSNSGGEHCGGGLHMIDIRSPLSPEFVGCFADTSTGFNQTGYTHDAMCVVYRGPDSEHRGRELCFGANETALSIADVTDKDAPVAVSVARYPDSGYTHQVWLDAAHEYLYMNDEFDEFDSFSQTRTLVWDVKDLDDPITANQFLGSTAATDHNLYVNGDLLYQSNYAAGLRILDIKDRENPEEVAYFDVEPIGEDVPGFNGSWSNYPFFASGLIAVTSQQGGVFFLRYSGN
jgi:choice-of-anchor B domain-containing protein